MKKLMFVLMVAVALALALAAMAQASPGWTTDVNLTNDGVNGNQASAVSPVDDSVHVVFTQMGVDIYYVKLAADGTTLIPKTQISDYSNSVNAQVPHIAICPDALASAGYKIHVVWHGTGPTSQSGNIMYTSSTDGGATWSSSVAVVNWAGLWHPRIAVDPVDPDYVYVVSHDSAVDIDFFRSSDGGVTWDTTVQTDRLAADDKTIKGEQTDIAVGPDRTIHVIFHSYSTGPPSNPYQDVKEGDIYYRYSTNFGATWSDTKAQLIYTDTVDDGWWNNLASIEVNSVGTIQIAARDDKVYYIEKTTTGGWTTSQIDTSSGGWKPETVLDSNDNLHLVYGKSLDVYYKMYDGTTWSNEQLTLAADSEGNPHIGVDSAGNKHVTYLNYTESDIHYLRFVPPPPPKEAKQGVIDDLSALLNGDKKTDHRIEKAIDHLNKSLGDDLWASDSHLTKKGKKVFEEEKKAVHELMKIDDPDISAAIDSLVGVDEALAQTAIEEAIATDGDAKEIDKAEKEMAKAEDEYDKGNLDKAIEHYKKAWHHAQKAMK